MSAPRFAKDGRIISRQRDDGYVWCPSCRQYLPAIRFCKRSARGWAVYCFTCHRRKNDMRIAKDPRKQERSLARQREYRRNVLLPRAEATRNEHRKLARVALERLTAIGLRYREIALLAEVSEKALKDLRNPKHHPWRSTMDKVLALFRAASDIPVGRNRASRFARHDFYAVLERRMALLLPEIEAWRVAGKYRRNVGSHA